MNHMGISKSIFVPNTILNRLLKMLSKALHMLQVWKEWRIQWGKLEFRFKLSKIINSSFLILFIELTLKFLAKNYLFKCQVSSSGILQKDNFLAILC